MGDDVRLAVGAAFLLFSVVFVIAELLHVGHWRRRLSGRHKQPEQRAYWRWPTPTQWRNEQFGLATWGVASAVMLIGGVANLVQFFLTWNWTDLAVAAAVVAIGGGFAFLTYRFAANAPTHPEPRLWARADSNRGTPEQPETAQE